uniref:Uncharacterized protein LOC110211545 isoform X1 n=1 Tax=Phascolarctos cinereus TaxID=38626 RepID=A0A6P5KLU8_PHACI|nr:uncharacterized protein LOC110211545 isoform X1 [Phascolarctos cinereus]
MRGGEGGSECPGRPALRSGQPAAPPTSAAAEPRGPGSGSITSGDGFSGRGDPGGMPGSVVCALDPLLGSSGGRVKVRVKFWAAGGICLPRQTDSPLAPLRPGNGSWAQTSRAGRGRVTDKEIEAERRNRLAVLDVTSPRNLKRMNMFLPFWKIKTRSTKVLGRQQWNLSTRLGDAETNESSMEEDETSREEKTKPEKYKYNGSDTNCTEKP